MILQSELDVLKLIENDEWMMKILTTVSTLNLPDWWICAGFVRSKIWDTLHGHSMRTPLSDVDVIFFDNQVLDEAEKKRLEQQLHAILPNEPWSVKNEARMHVANKITPYRSSKDAISKFPETATALGVKLDKQGNLQLAAPHGIKDVVSMEVRPTDFFVQDEERMKVYEHRVLKKDWKSTWRNLVIHNS